MTKKLPFAIGADPEFTYVNNNVRYSALDIMTNFHKDKNPFVEQGGKIMGYHIGEAGTIGWDGHDSSGEVRPKESTDPRKVTENMRILLKAAHDCMPTAEMKTTSLWMSIGGHIHLEARDYDEKTPKMQKIIQRALASLAIPLLANENPINSEIRREKGNGYGDILDARTNGITYEFRPLTAEWITTPEICNATLAYLAVCWNEIYNHPERIESFAEIIAKTDEQIRAIQEIVIDEYGALTEGLINRIKKHVRKFELYEQYKTECEYIFDIKRVKTAKEKVDFDIVRGWNFENTKETNFTPSIKQLTNKKETAKKLKNLNLDLINAYLQIYWTNERNMEKVARQIGDTTIAWNWALKNRYYLMPLPKGVPEPIMMTGKQEYLHGIEMIKTTGDYEKVKAIMKNGMELFAGKDNFKRTYVNLVEGKTETDEQKSVIIGIPYATREEKGDIKQIIELIHKHEAGKLKKRYLESPKDMNLERDHAVFKEGLLIEAIRQAEIPQPKTPETKRATNSDKAEQIINNRNIPQTNGITTDIMFADETDALTQETIETTLTEELPQF